MRSIKLTIEEWFNRVEDDTLREKLLINLRDEMSVKFEWSLSKCIENGFWWRNTQEGQEFWDDICTKASEGKIRLKAPETKQS